MRHWDELQRKQEAKFQSTHLREVRRGYKPGWAWHRAFQSTHLREVRLGSDAWGTFK